MGWFNRIFPSAKSVDKAVDAAIATGDKLFYTTEEKADDRAKMREWYLKLLGSMSAYNIAMRALAFIVAGLWSFLVIAITLFLVAGIFLCEPSADVCRPADAAGELGLLAKEHVTPYFAMIMAFYFGAAGINGAIRTYKGQ